MGEEQKPLITGSDGKKHYTKSDIIGLSIATVIAVATGGTVQCFVTKSLWAIQENLFVLFVIVALSAGMNGLLLLARHHALRPTQMCIKHKHMWAFALLLSVCGTFLTYCSPHVSGFVQAVLGLNVLPIPLGLFVSVLFLKKRYSIGKYCAVAVILIGIGVSVYVDLKNHKKDSLPQSSIPRFAWDLLYTCCSLMAILLIIYQDEVFLRLPEPPAEAYIQFWVMLYQTLVLMLLCPIDWIPDFGTSTPTTFWQNQARAVKCFWGYEEGCPVQGPCHCDQAAWNLLLASLFNFGTLTAKVYIIIHSNAVFTFVVSTLAAPLLTISFSFHFMMAPWNAQALSWEIGVSMLILLVGMVLYFVFEVRAAKGETLKVVEPITESIQ